MKGIFKMNDLEKKISELEQNIESLKENAKEIRGIYNVTFNDKKATPIKLTSEVANDIELVENAVIEEVIMYVKGWHNIRRDKGEGAKHILCHLNDNAKGAISLNELLNLGNSLRKYMEIFKEPYLENENKSGKVFEWQNDNGTRFRVAIDNKEIKNGMEGLIPPLSHSVDSIIISFYSDRNINKRMEFKNPKVTEYYENSKNTKSNRFANLVKPDDLANDDKTDKSKEIDEREI